MRPASAAPVAGSAGIPAVPKTPASSLPSAGRFRTAAPPHAGSVLPHTPPVELARIVPRLSSPALCPSRQKVIYCRIFTPVQPDYPAASTEGFSLRRLHAALEQEQPLRAGEIADLNSLWLHPARHFAIWMWA